MKLQHWILENGRPVEADMLTWARWFEKNPERVVERTIVGDAEVSTVFLGIDHSFDRGAPPLLFETMIFGGAQDQECWRYSTLGEAKLGHFRVVGGLRARLPENKQAGGRES